MALRIATPRVWRGRTPTCRLAIGSPEASDPSWVKVARHAIPRDPLRLPGKRWIGVCQQPSAGADCGLGRDTGPSEAETTWATSKIGITRAGPALGTTECAARACQRNARTRGAPGLAPCLSGDAVRGSVNPAATTRRLRVSICTQRGSIWHGLNPRCAVARSIGPAGDDKVSSAPVAPSCRAVTGPMWPDVPAVGD